MMYHHIQAGPSGRKGTPTHCGQRVNIMETLNVQGITPEMDVCPECVKAGGFVPVLLTLEEVQDLAEFLFRRGSTELWTPAIHRAYNRLQAVATAGGRA